MFDTFQNIEAPLFPQALLYSEVFQLLVYTDISMTLVYTNNPLTILTTPL